MELFNSPSLGGGVPFIQSFTTVTNRDVWGFSMTEGGTWFTDHYLFLPVYY